MVRVGKLADYALLLTNELVRAGERVTQTESIVAATHLPEATVRKLLRQLVKAGIVASFRGAHGGYQLAGPPDTLTVADVIAAIEGPIAFTECSGDHSHCEFERGCGLRENWSYINQAIVTLFRNITLADMARTMANAHREMEQRVKAAQSPTREHVVTFVKSTT